MEAGLIPAAPIWNDLRTFPWEEFQNVSLVSGGFPCQPFSAAGKRDGDQDPRHLFPFIIDGIKRCRPGLVFLENVEGILSSKLTGEGWADPAGTPVLLHVLRELERVGYKATAGIFSASEVGAPHQRKRVFILAHNKCEGSQGRIFGREDTQREALNGHLGCGGSSCGVWPSRPGQSQYAWEPPRTTKTMANSIRSGGEKPKHLDANLPTEPSGGDTESVGNASSERLYRGSEDGANQQSEMLGEGHEAVGDSECSETECSLGGDAYEPSIGVGISELSGLSDSELAEIREWMVKTDNRTDELRLLGNGVVPATATRAFLTLLEKLNG